MPSCPLPITNPMLDSGYPSLRNISFIFFFIGKRNILLRTNCWGKGKGRGYQSRVGYIKMGQSSKFEKSEKRQYKTWAQTLPKNPKLNLTLIPHHLPPSSHHRPPPFKKKNHHQKNLSRPRRRTTKRRYDSHRHHRPMRSQ